MNTEPRVRTCELERGIIDMSTGRFPMTLATDGEAMDGDILNIAGGQVPARMPLLSSHTNHPAETLGSITEPVKEAHKLRVVGQIELTGEGFMAEMRQGVAHLIDKGHITQVSLRWDPTKSIRRINLPADHPAFVKEDEQSWRKRYGVYHEKWRAMEGSVEVVHQHRPTDVETLGHGASVGELGVDAGVGGSQLARVCLPRVEEDEADTVVAGIEAEK